MGYFMALNLHKAGLLTAVWNRNNDKISPFGRNDKGLLLLYPVREIAVDLGAEDVAEGDTVA